MRAFIVIFALLLSTFSFAQTINAALESRAVSIGHQLRCVVCQNQSIEESDASLAEDMRRLVRARLKAGDSEKEILDFMQERYGDFVLLKPPVQSNTYLLWFTPFGAVLAGLLWFGLSRRRIAQAAPLSDDERAALDSILKGGKQ